MREVNKPTNEVSSDNNDKKGRKPYFFGRKHHELSDGSLSVEGKNLVKEKPKQKPESVSRQRNERRSVPRTRQLARANFLSAYWEKPLSALTATDGDLLPGLDAHVLPEDRSITLGDYLSRGQFRDFMDLQQAARDGHISKIHPILQRYEKLCPSPEALLSQNPDALNWVPWETFIAYGEVLSSQKTGKYAEDVAAVVSGDSYLSAVQEKFPQGFPKKRTEIVLERQNKDPQTQGILEAVSNSIDAISTREKIGQFGLGVKQVFSWLEQGEGVVSVVTKTAEGDVLSLQAKKGYDGELYLKFSEPTADDNERFSEGQTGTVMKISQIAVDSKKRKQMEAKLQERFRYVPETTIAVNGAEITGNDAIHVVGRETAVTPQGRIDVTLGAHDIVITDTGSGMDESTLFRMFLPGYGKGYEPLSPREAQTIAKEQAEVLLVQEQTPRVVFSRNREADFSVELPTDRLNTSTKTICIELGRILKVSEGRDGFEIDENFATAMSVLVEKTVRDPSLSDAEKTTFLNSVILGIDQLSGGGNAEIADKMTTIIKKTKKGIRNKAVPYLQSLLHDEMKLLPNHHVYGKLDVDAQYVDPYLLKGVSELGKLFQREGFEQRKGNDGIVTKNGWKVFTAPLREDDGQNITTQILRSEGIRAARQSLTELLPVMLDAEHRIVMVDQQLWQRIDQEIDPVKKAYLQESLQAVVNEKVVTSYESEDPREIQINEKLPRETTASTETRVVSELSYAERIVLDEKPKNLYMWQQGDMICTISKAGVLKQFDAKTRGVISTVAIPDFGSDLILRVQPTERGSWVLKSQSGIMLIDTKGNIVESYDTPLLSLHKLWQMDAEDSVSVTTDGKIIQQSFSEGRHSIQVYDPQTQTQESHDLPYIYSGIATISPNTDRGFFLSGADGVLHHFDQDKLESFGDSPFHKKKIYDKKIIFFEYDGKQYCFGVSTSPNYSIGVFELTQEDRSVSATYLLDQPLELAVVPSHMFDEHIGEIMAHPDLDSGTVGIQVGDEFFLLEKTSQGFQCKEKFIAPFIQESYFMKEAIHSLKELFGDDSHELYTDGLLTFRERLGGQFVRTSRKKELHQSAGKILFGRHDRYNTLEREMPIDQPPKGGLNTERRVQFCAAIAAPEFRETFHQVWNEVQESVSGEDLVRLKMRFIKNSPLLLDLSGERPTPELLRLFFLSENPQVFFEQERTHQALFTQLLDSIESLSYQERLVAATETFTRGKSPEDCTLFYGQLAKLFEKEKFGNDFLRAMTQSEGMKSFSKAVSQPEKLSITDPLRAYTLFLTNQADLIRAQESVPQENYNSVVSESIPLELLAYFRLTDGQFHIEDMAARISEAGGVAALREQVNLSHYQDEIKKAVHAQSTEAGVSKRELFQNALSALQKKGGSGNISVDFYVRDKGEEFVEEITDTGTGIEDLVSFLVPGVTTKDESGGLGVFGTGFYKTLEDVDHIEVESTKHDGSQMIGQRVIIDVSKDADGIVQGGVVRTIETKPKSRRTKTGTTIRFVRKTTGVLPELEAMIAKNTYVTMGGLATKSEISGVDLSFGFIDEEGRTKQVDIPVTDQSALPLEGIGEIMFLKSPLPSQITSSGLRMSSLGSSSDYFDAVPEKLKKFFDEERISIVLPKDLQLVKDRSRLAHEEQSLPVIQQAIATETLKRVAYDLLSEHPGTIRGMLPGDVFTSPRYYKEFVSGTGKQAYSIAQKINAGMVLDADDLSFVNNPSHEDALVLTLIGIEQSDADGNKDSLLRRFQYIQKKFGDAHASHRITEELSFDETETVLPKLLQQEEMRLSSQAKERVIFREKIQKLDQSLDLGKNPDGVQSLQEVSLSQEEKKLLTDYFSCLGLTQVYFVPEEKIGAVGSYGGNRMYLNDTLLSSPPRERCETIRHETSHIFEERAKGMTSGVFDTASDKGSNFTHQQKGAFADYYKLAALLQLQTSA